MLSGNSLVARCCVWLLAGCRGRLLFLAIDWLQGEGCCVWLLTGYRVKVVVSGY